MILNEKTPYIENGSIYLQTPLEQLCSSDLLDIMAKTGAYLADIKFIIDLIEQRKNYNEKKLYRCGKWCYLTGEKVKLQAQGDYCIAFFAKYRKDLCLGRQYGNGAARHQH